MPDELIRTEVPGSVASVVDVVTASLRRRGVTVFSVVDHAAGARAAGLDLADEVLLVFGDPAVGTALMQADPTVGYELPLRMLVWSQHGVTHLAHRSPDALIERYAVGGEGATLVRLRSLLEQLAADAAAAPRS